MPVATRPFLRARTVALAAAMVLALTVGACATEADENPLADGNGDGSPTSGTTGDEPATSGTTGDEPATSSTTGEPEGEDGGTGEAPPVPSDPVAAFEQAITATQSVTSAAVTVDLSVTAGASNQTATLDGEFDVDDVGSLDAGVESDGRRVELDVLSDGDTAWLRSDDPGITGGLPPGALWVEAPVAELRDTGVFSGIDDTFGVLPVLRGVGEVRDGGTAAIGDETVRLLEGDVDWEVALAAATGEEARALQESISFTGDAQPVAFTAVVGLDAEGRARRLALDVTAASPSSPALGVINLRLAYDVIRFDHEVTVPAAPPPAEIVPLAQVPGVIAALTDGL